MSLNRPVQTAERLTFVRHVSVSKMSEMLQAVLTEGLRDFIHFLIHMPEKNLQSGHDCFHNVSSSSSTNYFGIVPSVSPVSDRTLKHISKHYISTTNQQ